MIKLTSIKRDWWLAKGYKQEYGVDYKEIFIPIVRHDTIRLVITLAAQNW